jgi:hypothetical protein
MTNQPSVDAGCSLVGEYLDEAELPPTHGAQADKALPRAEELRPRIVACYLDSWSRDDTDGH